MPRIFTIGRLKIYMYFFDHRPSHIHVFVGNPDNPEREASFDLNGHVIAGGLKAHETKTIRKWIRKNQAMLQIIWSAYEQGNRNEEEHHLKG
jgi:hypothetical protein